MHWSSSSDLRVDQLPPGLRRQVPTIRRRSRWRASITVVHRLNTPFGLCTAANSREARRRCRASDDRLSQGPIESLLELDHEGIGFSGCCCASAGSGASHLRPLHDRRRPTNVRDWGSHRVGAFLGCKCLEELADELPERLEATSSGGLRLSLCCVIVGC
jgi:hypothetical protein